MTVMPPSMDATADSERLLSIGDLAHATGIAPDTLRAWERRYGRPEAVRLPSGHRRYTPEHVRWLRRVAEALSRGHRPAKIVRLADDDLTDLLEADPGDAPPPAAITQLLAAIAAADLAGTRKALLLELDRLGPRGLVRDRVAPLLHAVGRAWADGDISIRHEHLASEAVAETLRIAREQSPTPTEGPILALATLPEEGHALGLQMVAIECAAHSVRARVLGPDMPLEEIVAAAREVSADAVGISVSLATGGVATDRHLARLRRQLPESVRLVVGGTGARGVRRGPHGIEYAAREGVLDAWLADLADTHRTQAED